MDAGRSVPGDRPKREGELSVKGLQGLRVLELGELVSAAYATKMMADLGAEVVKIEAPEGDRARARGPFRGGADAADPEKSGLYVALNTNKRSVVLDLTTDEGREQLDALVASTDILVHNVSRPQMAPLGLDYDRLRNVRPELVMCSITTFGLTGPYADYRAEEITAANAGGWCWLSPGVPDFPEHPPLKAFGHQADFQAGIAGATAALAARHRAQRTGEGEHIDLSTQSYIASILEQAWVYYTYLGLVSHRAGARGLNPWGIYECSDGLIFLATIEEDQWQRLIEFMGNPEWASMELFDGFPARYANADALRIFLQEWIATWKVDDLFHEGQRRRICFAPVLTMKQLAGNAHLAERGFFTQTKHPRAGTRQLLGAPYKLRERWWDIVDPAPLLGQHNDDVFFDLEKAATLEAPSGKAHPTPAKGSSRLPLEGVRIADFSWVWAGPFCAMQLAHLGAEVIKIESRGRPDLGRRLAVFARDTEPGINRSGYFNQWNQGKKSVCLNLANPAAIPVVKQLVSQCDVVVENFASGVMDRLGIGYETLLAERPDLIMASISGYGETGPMRDYMGYGPAIAPISGLSALSGYAGEAPSEVGLSLGDPTAGITAAAAVCAALVSRAETGRGQHIDCSLWESTAALVAEGFMEWDMNGQELPRMGNRDPWMSPHGVYPCAGEDAWVSIACATEEEWRALCAVVSPQLESDPRFATATLRKQNEDALEDLLAQWTSSRDRWEVTKRLQAVSVAAFPTMTPEDLAHDPHLEARGFSERLPHPEIGPRQHGGIPWRLSTGPNGVRAPAPCIGAHTEEIFGGLLGFSDEELARMVEEDILT